MGAVAARAKAFFAHGPWLFAALGLALMYGPTLWSLAHSLWSTDDQGHGPIVLALAVWMIARRWRQIDAPASSRPLPWLAWPLLLLSALFYALGRSQGIWLFEVGSALGMVGGSLLLLRGPSALRAAAFGLFFMAFMIPLPGALVDALTQPMKLAVSHVAESLLSGVGYPISRSGVILYIGPYVLLVADACAGLHTLFTLEALGLLYLNLVRSSSMFRNVVLAILIVPISFCANVIRVVALALITYHFGDEAGQGYLHGVAGFVPFISALLLIMGVDSLLRRTARRLEGAA